MTFRIILLMIALSTAAFLDLTQRRIPNWLTVTTTLLGVLAAGLDGKPMLKASLLGFAFGLGVGILLWLLGAIKAGDAKLIAAAGSIMGFPWVINELIWTFIAAAALGILVLLKKRELRVRAKRIWDHLKGMLLQRKLEQYKIASGAEHEMPFAVAVLCGTVLALIYPV